MSSKKDIKEIINKLRKQGWEVQSTKRSHWKAKSPTGKVCYLPGTPSDYRSIAEVRGKLRRAGADL